MLSLRKNRHTILYGSQGCGKSVLAAFMAESSALKKNRTLILSHRTEILKQNFKKMDMLGLKVALINAQTKYIPDSEIFCAMSQTLAARCASEKVGKEYRDFLQTIDFVIVDEVHRQEHEFLYPYLRKDCWAVGMSATILRAGYQKQLGDFYSDIVKAVSTKELIDLGFLVPAKSYAFQAPRLDDVEVNRATGDYDPRALAKKFQSPERYAGIIDNYKRICPGSKCLVFTCGIDHCIELCRSFNEAGIKTKYLVSERRPETDGIMSGKREKLMADFKHGEFDILVGISIFDTGYDEPSVQTVILDFSTKSYARYAQAVGRGSRPSEGKTHFSVLDFGANCDSFGLFDEVPPMSLWHSVSLGGVAPQKECPADRVDRNGKSGCLRLVPISAQDCPYCGFHWETDKEVYEVELQEVIKTQLDENQTIAQFCAEKKLAGWKNLWIIQNICIKNKGREKEAFMAAIAVLNTGKGEKISENYWHFFKKNYLDNKKKKK